MNTTPKTLIALIVIQCLLAREALVTADADGADADSNDSPCSNVCNSNCNLGAVACQILPGLSEVCARNLALCTNTCSVSCGCFDACVARCQGDASDCVDQDETVVVGSVLCSTTATQCLLSCPVACGFRTGSAVFNGLLSTINLVL